MVSAEDIPPTLAVSASSILHYSPDAKQGDAISLDKRRRPLLMVFGSREKEDEGEEEEDGSAAY